MIRQSHTAAREMIVADAIRDVVSELRMVEVADYIAFLRLGHYACISDLVDSAAELYFQPRTLRLGNGGEAHVDWGTTPRVDLDLELRPRGATVYFTLGLAADAASVTINYVAFDAPDADPDRNAAFLTAAIEDARIRPAATANAA